MAADFNQYYRAFILMQETLRGDFTHKYLTDHMAHADSGEDVHSGKNYRRVIDMDWVEAIEDAVPYIDKAIREQRRFIIQNEDIVPIEKARKITNESVRHLAQHTNMIARVDGDAVTPERILEIQREESFAIYENRFLRTLLMNVSRFVDARYKELKMVPNDSFHKLHMSRKLKMDDQIVEFELSYSNETHETTEFDINADVESLTDYQRVSRLRRVLGDFSASPLMRSLSNAELVRPPIQRTNLMTKNPNFKKALDLWLFIESYTKTGFEIVGDEYSGKMEENMQLAMYNVMSYEHFVICIATNPALQRLLHRKYLEEEARLKAENENPRDRIMKEAEAKIAKVREEEAAIRLEEIRKREKQIAELNAQLSHAKLTIRQYEVKMTEMKGLINLHETTIQKLKDQIFEMEKERKVLLEKLQALADLVNEQKEVIARLTEEKTALQKTLAEKDAEISRQREVIAKAEEALHRCKEELAALKQENGALQAQVTAQAATISGLEKDVASLREELYRAAEEIGLLKKTISAKDAELEQNRNTITTLNQNLAEKTSALQKEVESHRRDTEQFRTDLQEKESRIFVLSNDLNAQKSENETNRRTIDTLNEKISGTEQRLTDTIHRHAQETDALRQAHAAELKMVTEEHARQADIAASTHAKQLSEMQDSYESKLGEERSRHESEISAMQTVCDLRIRQQKEAADKEAEAVVAKERSRHEAEMKKAAKDYEHRVQQLQRRSKQELARAVKNAEAEAEEKLSTKLKAVKAANKADKINAKLATSLFKGLGTNCEGIAAAELQGTTVITNSSNKSKHSELSIVEAVLAELEDSKSRLIAADKAVVLLQTDGLTEDMKAELSGALREKYGFERPTFLNSAPAKRGASDRRLVIYYFKKV